MKSILTFLVVFTIRTAAAQHIIYLTDESKIPGKVIEITSNKIKYKIPTDITGPTHTHALDNVAFAFNESGGFLVFSNETSISKNEKDDFIKATDKIRDFDLLVDTTGRFMPVNISNETNAEIICVDKGKKLVVPTASLSFLLRKNGSHQVFSSIRKASKILAKNKEKINTFKPEQLAKPADKSQNKITTFSLTSKEQNDFRVKAQGQIESFKQYLNVLTETASKDRKASANAINLACKLFISDTSKVQVTSKVKNTTETKKIRDYLKMLGFRASEFDKVTIDYVNVNWGSQFMLGTDGYLHGNVTFVQVFQGTSDGKIIFKDQTRKNFEIIIKSYDKAIDGKSERNYQVFLGDIGVSER